ncbi:MAG TPA: nitrilase-related carbon-nitrogen hydrolase [Candidatus Nanopelagicaceae bacterium]|nr:nitrilase-related carbon-nitrogen hydrolase [Candidatus Nanopelagicaceae bacterium]
MQSSSSLRVALCQYEPRVGDLPGNLATGSRFITQAAAAGADLVILPELAASGYTFESEPEAASSSQTAEDLALTSWGELCHQHGLWLVAGFAEAAGQRRYNAAALISPEGLAGVYRKAHLFNDEKLYFSPGDTGFLSFEIPWGRIGILICYDLWFPEAARLLALRGAEMICVPTNWVANFRRQATDERGWTMGDYACVGAATQNQVFVAAADRVGEERGVQFVGCSCLVGPDGSMLTGPAPLAGESLLVQDVDLEWARRARRRTPRNDTFGDRRPELYGDLLGRVDQVPS